ncbi:hypothetical protein ABPG77_004671 [Micractinium sp. CCAP 211/92]
MAPSRTGFLHGVASFDPLPDSVLIWTRLTVLNPSDVVEIHWEVSDAQDFANVVASGRAVTDEGHDWTVTVDVTGLQPATRYFYRFASGKLRSPMGITKTAGQGRLDELVFASVSCANWAFGHFHVYDLLTRVDGLDFVLHCGDYCYEYEKRFYPSARFMARHGLRPKHRCTSLQDYRQRYACYRTDPALQELHRRVPFIAVYDDHEIADSAHTQASRGGAEDVNGNNKEWERQKHEAVKAFIEWVPVRGASHDKIDLAACHRTFQFGDLATLMLVENRISNRSPPVDLPETEFYKQTAQKELSKWDNGAIQAARSDLLRQLADPGRQMIGPEQLQDVAEAVQQSVGAGVPWQIFCSQTVFSQIRAPKLLETVHLQPRLLASICKKALGVATNVKRAGKEGAEQARMYLGMGKYGVPMNPDAYDGYAAEREKLLRIFSLAGSNPVVLAGDSHNAWCHEIMDSTGSRLGVEFDAPAVTSIGAFEDIYSRFVEKVGWLARLFPLWLFTPWLEDALAAANPDTLRYSDLDHRGCILFHVTKAKWHAEFHFVNDVSKKKYRSFCGGVFDAEAGARGRVKKGVRYMTIDGEIPRMEKSKRAYLLRGVREVSRSTPDRW